MNERRFFQIAMVAIALLLPATAYASLTWDADPSTTGVQDGNGTWMANDTNYQNWTADGGTTNEVWPTAGDVAVFGAGGTAGTVAVGAASTDVVTATGLTFNKGYTLTGPGELALSGETTPLITMFSGNNPTINAELTGGDINVDGANGGTLYLGAANSWTGNLSMINPQFTANPAIAAVVSDALSPNGTVSLAGGAYLNFPSGESVSFSTALNLGGYGAGDAVVHATRGVLIISGVYPDVTLSGPITLTADAAFCTSNGTTTPYPLMVLSGNIGETAGGPKSITTTGVGNIELRGNNTFTGDLIHYRSYVVTLNSPVGVAVPGNFVFRSNTYGGELRIAQNEQIGGIIDFAYTGTTANRQIVNLMDVTETLKGIQMTNTKETVGVVQNGGTVAATLVLDTPEGADYVFNGKLQDGGTGGTLALTKRGIGKQTLAGTCLLSGGTTVEAGMLVVNGSLTSDVAVQGGLLMGTGVVSGAIDVAADGSVAPGASIGTLVVNGDVALAGTLDVEYDSSTDQIDVLMVSGELDLSGGILSFADLATSPAALDQEAYVFASYGTLVGSLPMVENLPSGYVVDYAYGETNNQIALVVPEPSTFLLLLAGLVLAAWKRP